MGLSYNYELNYGNLRFPFCRIVPLKMILWTMVIFLCQYLIPNTVAWQQAGLRFQPHVFQKKIKRSLFGTLLTYLKKLCLCVRFKNNWNQGCKNLNSSSRMFWLQLLPRALKGTEWKPCAVWGTHNVWRGLKRTHVTPQWPFQKIFIFVFQYVF